MLAVLQQAILRAHSPPQARALARLDNEAAAEARVKDERCVMGRSAIARCFALPHQHISERDHESTPAQTKDAPRGLWLSNLERRPVVLWWAIRHEHVQQC